jgi:hypothetical protein
MSLHRRSFISASAALAASATASCGTIARAAADKPERDIDPKHPGKSCKTKFAVNCEMWFGKLPFLDRVKASAFPPSSSGPIKARTLKL